MFIQHSTQANIHNIGNNTR